MPLIFHRWYARGLDRELCLSLSNEERKTNKFHCEWIHLCIKNDIETLTLLKLELYTALVSCGLVLVAILLVYVCKYIYVCVTNIAFYMRLMRKRDSSSEDNPIIPSSYLVSGQSRIAKCVTHNFFHVSIIYKQQEITICSL